LFGVGAASAQPLQLKLRTAAPAFDLRNGQPMVSVRMTEESARDFARFTTENVGRTLDIRVDGKIVLQPIVREPIWGGAGQIPVANAEEGRALAARLASGAAILEVEVSKD
jgi:preprotein translocase subunit SecD